MRGKRLNRLLQVIALLRGPTSWNVRRLAEHFHTSRRNIYRDLAVLELAGVPFYYDPQYGEGGGYRIRPEWWFPSVSMTEQEVLDLAVIARVAETSSIPLLENVSEVRDKLLGTLPAKQQDLIKTASELFDILSVGISDHSDSRGIMVTLQGSLLRKLQVEATYRSPHQQKVVKLQLQPRRIFLCGSAWYIAAHDNKANETKLYRLARFQSMKLTEKSITVETNFSLREFLGNAWTVHRGERDWHIEIYFDASTAPLVAETKWHHTQELEWWQDGSLTFRVTVSGLEEIKYWVLQWGPGATVVKPRELAEEVQALLESTLCNYGRAQRSTKSSRRTTTQSQHKRGETQ